MALIGYYMRLFIALTQAKSDAVLEWVQSAPVIMSSVHGSMLKCCMAARVRRCTAATGE